MATVRVGISGFRYSSFRGTFYPTGLRQRDELAYAAARLGTVEINGSFYRLLRPQTYACYHEQTPNGFVFAVKGSRYITHTKKLIGVREAVANFFASGVLCLEDKLGPILWQLPGSMPCESARLQALFELLPGDRAGAVRLAKRYASRGQAGALRAGRPSLRLRYALEVRHPDCVTPELTQLLSRYEIALVIADAAGRFPCVEALTTDFVYVRLHGHTELYASGYGPRLLKRWAERVVSWNAAGKDVYLYFDNTTYARAPFDAIALQRALSRQGCPPTVCGSLASPSA